MVKNTLKWAILAYASEPDKNYRYEGDVVEYNGKRYWVSLMNETVEFVGIVNPTVEKNETDENVAELKKTDDKLKVDIGYPVGVEVEPEYIVNSDGSIKFTGFGLVRR